MTPHVSAVCVLTTQDFPGNLTTGDPRKIYALLALDICTRTGVLD